tara:strand:+ start:75 stop:1127 length:1053 start_codon:yes stop_codon:yes gene_type:complete
MKRITFVLNSLEVGGTEKQLLKLVELISKRFYLNLYVFSLGDLKPHFENLNIKINFCKFKYLQIFHFLIFLIFNKTDIYHFFLPKSYILGGIFTYFSKKKKIMSRRSLNNYHRKFLYLSLILERFLHRKMDFLIANCDTIVNQLISDEGADKSKVHLVRNFIIKSKTKFKRKQKKIVNFIYVANFIGYKRHLKLINYCKSLETKRVWNLYLFGKDKFGLLKKIKSQIYLNNLTSKIKVVSNVSDMKDFYKAMDFAVCTSSEEGSSNFLLESINSGLPILAFDVGGNKDFCNDKNGYLIQENDDLLFKKKLEEMIDSDKLNKMGKESKRICIDIFNNKKSLSKLIKIYNNN